MSEHELHHHGHAHHGGDDAENKRIGLTISIIAVIMAVMANFGRDAGNKAIVYEVKTSNNYAWYQAKRLRSHLNELEIQRIDTTLASNPPTGQREALEKLKTTLGKNNEEYKTELETIRKDSQEFEKIAKQAAHLSHGLENAETLLHIAVVLCSVTLLTNQRIFTYGGIGLTVIALGLSLWTYLHISHEAGHAEAPRASVGTPSNDGQQTAH